MQSIPYSSLVNQCLLEITSDGLIDPSTGVLYPIINGIPRFCPHENYSESFGFQWNIFDTTQLDVYSGSDLSEVRFYASTGWDKDLLSCSAVLEVGCGAGRFSEVFLRSTTGVLHSIDYSSSVEVNKRNNAIYGNRLQLAQASIYDIPYLNNTFDFVFCLGVLQHTPSFSNSVKSLINKTRVGGEIVVDFYSINGWYTKIHSKYIFRPITKRLPKTMLLKCIRLNIRWMLVLFDLLRSLGLGVLNRFIPITDVSKFPNNLSTAQRREWAVMDTFDAFSPEFDNPQTVKNVSRMFSNFGCEVTHAGWVHFRNGPAMVVRAIKRSA